MQTKAPVEPLHELGRLPSARHIRAALRANVLYSIACGVTLLVGGPFLATSWGLGPMWLVLLVGAGLFPFAAIVARAAALPAPRLRFAASLVIAADAGWLIASAVLLGAADLPTPGAAAVVTVAAGIAVIAVWQTAAALALRQDDPLGDFEVMESRRVMDAHVSEVWPVITDHDLYGRLAPNLSKVEVISDTGQPLRRKCVDSSGHGWEESCTLWEDQHRYAVQVDTSDYPYPVSSMHGLWQADPAPNGTLVTMRFVYALRPTLRGGLFGVAARAGFPRVVGRIFTGWQDLLAGGPSLVP